MIKMTKVNVRFFQELRTLTGQSEIQVDGSTLSEVFKSLIATYGDELKDMLFDEESRIRSFAAVYINNKHVPDPNGYRNPLSEGDLILIIPPVSGGLLEDGSKQQSENITA